MHRMNAYSEDLRNKIVEALRRGATKSETARAFGVSRSSLRQALKVLEKKRPDLVELIHLAYFARYTVPEIIDFLGADETTGSKPGEKKIDRALKDARLMLKEIISKLLCREDNGDDEDEND